MGNDKGIGSGVIFTYASGTPMGENLTAVRTYGQTLAHIHTITDRLPFPLARTPLDLAFLLDRPLAHLANLAHYHQGWAGLHQVAAAIRPQLAALSTMSPTPGYCHGDVGANNAHVDATGQVMLFDFDCWELGWRAYDLATFVNGKSTEVAAAFLEGYQPVRSLTPAEQAALPLFQIAQGSWMFGTRASYLNGWGEIHFTDRFIDQIRASIKIIFVTVGSSN